MMSANRSTCTSISVYSLTFCANWLPRLGAFQKDDILHHDQLAQAVTELHRALGDWSGEKPTEENSGIDMRPISPASRMFEGLPSLPPLALRIASAAFVRSEISRRSFSASAA